jgi:hypothetical protein
MERKGVSIIFEQVLLFMIGVIIFMICFATFNSYELYFRESITANQLREVNEWVVSNIIMLSEKESGVNTTLRVRVPEFVGNEPYEIRLTQGGLNVTGFVSGKSAFSTLSAINQSFLLMGGFSTLHGNEFVIYKQGNKIIIG